MRILLAGLFLAGAMSTAQAAIIPLEKGLVLIYEGYDPGDAARPAGYLERLVTVTDVTLDHIGLEIQFNDHVGDQDAANTTIVDRVVRSEDLDNAHRIISQYLAEDPPMLPGSLYFHGSKAMLTDLDGGVSHLVFGDAPPNAHQTFFSVGMRKYFRGDLKVVEPHAAIPVLVNGTEAKLDAVHAGGSFAVADMQTSQDFWFSTDASDPLILRQQGRAGNYIQLVRADVVAAAPEKKEVASAVETGLNSKDCRATLPGIYFGTGSDVLLPASQPALKQVGDVLAQHKDWQLTIEGHTDNVGSDDYNLDLSKRRAASVKAALVSSFGADDGHLATTGFGESRPVETNDTPVGRAANRRVELARSCG